MEPIYTERKTYIQYDDGRYLLYLGEEVKEYTPIPAAMGEERGEVKPVQGYSYSGNMPDGGTLIEAREVSYPEFASGLIRLKYPINEELALLRKIAAQPAGNEALKAEFEAYNQYAEECKAKAKEVLNRQ